ncbi:MAG: hypothetical protein RIF40_26685 [Imperialibacter sp.]
MAHVFPVASTGSCLTFRAFRCSPSRKEHDRVDQKGRRSTTASITTSSRNGAPIFYRGKVRDPHGVAARFVILSARPPLDTFGMKALGGLKDDIDIVYLNRYLTLK